MTGLDGEIRDGRHVMPVRVYYEDTDFSGVVYHANYLRLIGVEHAELWEAAKSEAPGFAFVVRAMRIEFLKPARMDDLLTVVTAPEEVKGASMWLTQRVMRGEEVLIEARVKVACVAGGRARPIPKALRLAMRADQDRASPHPR